MKVYSYTRWSTPEQTLGDSERRQIEAARKWAADRGLVLDEKRKFNDAGVSAYHGVNILSGALGSFLGARYQPISWLRA